MPTVIDSLIVEFGLDPTKFTDGEKVIIAGQKKLEDASNRARKNTEENAGKQSIALNEVTQSALKLFAVFTAGKGLERFVADTIKGNAALGRTATNINMSTDALSKWQNAFERGGGTKEGLTGTLSGLTTEIQKFQATGRSDVLPWLNRLGIDMTDPKTGKLKENTEIMLELADRLHSMPVAQANFFGSQIGIDQDTLNVLRQGRTALQDLLDTQDKIGHTTKADSDAAKLLQTDLRELGQASGRTGEIILTDLTPALDGLLKKLVQLAEWGQQHKGIAEIILGVGGIGAFAATVATLRRLLGLIGLGGGGLGGFAGAVAGGAVISQTASFASLPKNPRADAGYTYDEKHGYQPSAGTRTVDLGGRLKMIGPNPRDVLENARRATSAVKLFSGLEGAYSLPAGLLDATWATESGRGSNMLSPAGAKGHFQFMDATARAYGVSEPNDLGQSATGAAHYFSDLLKHYGGDLNKALAGYNWGQTNLDKDIAKNGAGWRTHLPGETMDYIAKVTNAMPAGTGRTRSSSVHIGSIVVNTQATDAKGIGQAIGPVVKSNLLATQANTGLQ